LLRPERWEDGLDMETEIEEIHRFLRKARNGKAVGIYCYPIVF
jgi:hypothetical protein